ncbi:MAG: TolC family protein [Hydrogenophaga sp.]
MNAQYLKKCLRPSILVLALSASGLSAGEAPGLQLTMSHSLARLSAGAVPAPGALPGAINDPIAATPIALRAANPIPTNTGASPGPAARWASETPVPLPGEARCEQMSAPPWDRLRLGDALSLSICRNPLLRQALASVAEQRAGLDLAESAKRPSWTANLGATASRDASATAGTSRVLRASIDLSWVLFDFGQRDASLTEARQTLIAALSTQGNAVLDAVRDLVQKYGEAVVADAALSAAKEAEATAQLTATAAQARYNAQVGTQIDRLQSQTALAQANLARVRAESDWENARGELALALGADITQPLRLTDWATWGLSNNPSPPLESLRQEARAQHPQLTSKEAQIASRQARLSALQAQSKGSLSLTANGGSSRNWGGADTASGGASQASRSVGVSASVPLFAGQESRAQQAQALAQIATLEAELEALRREIDTQIWQAHRALLTSEQSVLASERLLTAASSTYEVAQGRYKAGVGSVVDVLNAQSALADARRQRVSALIDRLTAGTQLSLAAGRLDF